MENQSASERNREIANEKLMLYHYMHTRSFFPPTPPIARTYHALQNCGYKMDSFTDADILEITEILKEKKAESNEGCVTFMLVVFAVVASIVSKGILIPVFAVFIFWQYKKRKIKR